MQELTKEEKNKILQEHPNIVEVKKVKNCFLFVYINGDQVLFNPKNNKKSIKFITYGYFRKIFYLTDSDKKYQLWNPENGENSDWFQLGRFEIKGKYFFLTDSSDNVRQLWNPENGKKTSWLKLKSCTKKGDYFLLRSLFGSVATLNPETMEISPWEFK